MAVIKVRSRWMDFAVPILVSVILFAGVLVWWSGASVVYAIGYSLMFNAVVAALDLLRIWRRDAKRRLQQQANCAEGSQDAGAAALHS